MSLSIQYVISTNLAGALKLFDTLGRTFQTFLGVYCQQTRQQRPPVVKKPFYVRVVCIPYISMQGGLYQFFFY